jgi:hypothetical protein
MNLPALRGGMSCKPYAVYEAPRTKGSANLRFDRKEII